MSPSHPAAPSRRRAGGTLGPTLLLALAGGCGDGEPPPWEDASLLLVLVDTLGAEHLGAWGAPTRTPRLDDLAQGGVRFDRASSTAPWTKPATASLLTGLLPSRHGVRRIRDPLAEPARSLAELARDAGMRTRGVVSHVLLTSEHGFSQGFEAWDESSIAGHDGITSAAVTDAAVAALEAVAGERFLLFVHYFDPHYVYHHHPAFPHTGPYEGPVAAGMDVWELRGMRARLDERDREQLVGLYREEIAHTDHQIGRLLDALEARGLAGSTLVVVTADHGEELLEHGWIGHTRTLHDELLHVPLVLSLPGRLRPRVVDEPVSLVDVLPTLAELLDLPAPPPGDGLSLVPLLRGADALAPERVLFAEVSFGPRDPERSQANAQTLEKTAHKTAALYRDLKLVHDETTGAWELYDRASDPGELHDRWAEEGSPEHPLRRRLEAWEAGRAQEDATGELELDAAELEELRRLGYVR